ncbi:MAG TPA: SUF system NifU family Fe-S cluster assembly protein [Acidimicrobiales bacterium]|nr:SUF system NifU family Fe-S cluster assembly protein [Acidimicrobiales bacterium]
MNELADLYREVIIDHSRHPQNRRRIEGATVTAEGVNPLCGDQLTLYVNLAEGRIDDIAFEGEGCAISVASASLMTGAIMGKPEGEALEIFERVHTMLTGDSSGDVPPAELGKLAVLSGVSDFPMRVKCATLAWHTLRSALRSPGDRVSTETTGSPETTGSTETTGSPE